MVTIVSKVFVILLIYAFEISQEKTKDKTRDPISSSISNASPSNEKSFCKTKRQYAKKFKRLPH